jgi:hypothetical protein
LHKIQTSAFTVSTISSGSSDNARGFKVASVTIFHDVWVDTSIQIVIFAICSSIFFPQKQYLNSLHQNTVFGVLIVIKDAK